MGWRGNCEVRVRHSISPALSGVSASQGYIQLFDETLLPTYVGNFNCCPNRSQSMASKAISQNKFLAPEFTTDSGRDANGTTYKKANVYDAVAGTVNLNPNL